MEIILEHVRSFASMQRIPLRPLTLLVGENSTGKSTFLAAVSCIFDARNFPLRPAFNNAPYSLGTFDTIATYKAGRYGRASEFSLGFATEPRGKSHAREATATYGNTQGQVVLTSFTAKSEHGLLRIELDGSSLRGSLRVQQNGKSAKVSEVRWESEHVLDRVENVPLYALQPFIFESVRRQRKTSRVNFDDIHHLMLAMDAAQPPFGSCYSCAPIRSKPRRTYDELAEEYNPEGDHIPTLLARLLAQERDSSEAKQVLHALEDFGDESGLFKRVSVKRLGKKSSDPFQLQVVVSGPPANLIDVGYGVSQALPIIVQSALKEARPALLMQQPEVHLHPRAQAALGTFFAKLAAPERNQMIVLETHSDYLVDRVRQEVATGRIAAERVLILFFHKPDHETTVSRITLDRFGNVENAPREYREFFLAEELNLLNRTS